MIIEFVGPPGSGKTTVANILRDRLRSYGGSNTGREEVKVFTGPVGWPHGWTGRCTFARYLYSSVIIVLNLRLFWMFIALGSYRFSLSAIKAAFNFVMETRGFRALSRAAKDDVIIVSEGPIQWAFTLSLLNGANAPNVPRYFRDIYRGIDVKFLYFAVAKETCVERFLKVDRCTSRFGAGVSDELLTAFLNYDYDALVRIAVEASGKPLQEVDAAGDPEEIAGVIARSDILAS